MGPQRILQAAAAVVACVATAAAAPAPTLHPKGIGSLAHERVAVIDLGPAAGDSVRKQIVTAVVTAGLDPVIGDGVEDALAGITEDRDAPLLASAMQEAQRAFGALDCGKASTAATTATTLGAARQAAGVPVPELPRAWTYLLLCADRAGATDTAMLAASRLRALGGSSEIPPEVWVRYPDVDTMGGHDLVEVDIAADAPGAIVWIDHRRAGAAPVHAVLPAGTHVIAAANGSRRGAVQVDLAPSKVAQAIAVSAPDLKGAWSELATRIASWHGKVPKPTELAWVMTRVHARISLVRYGDTIEVWGQPGRAEPPHRLGGEDGVGTIAELSRVLGLAMDRVHAWNDRAPDPDQPLLLDTARAPGRERADEPTKWWVYATIAGAIATGAVILYVHDNASDIQHVELHTP